MSVARKTVEMGHTAASSAEIAPLHGSESAFVPRIVGEDSDEATPELSVVIPCLNEADTIGVCVAKAWRAIREMGIDAEVIVTDNGSVDRSVEIAREAGARVVHIAERGYGSALMGGIAAARGRYVIMGDADDSYDFLELPKFVEKLRAGHELVQGCRFPSGQGRILPGAMPFLHRWLGNPVLSYLVRRMFRSSVRDVYCGFRGFTRELALRLDLRCRGMEFATEMIIKSSLTNQSMAEVPITLHPDGRTAHGPHLRTFRDGWRTLRFFMLYSPRWLYLVPGMMLMALGLTGFGLAMPGVEILGAKLDAHTLLFSTLFVLMGYQAVWFAVLTKLFAVSEHLLPADTRMRRFERWFSLETGLGIGSVAFLAGVSLLAVTVWRWWQSGFGPMDYASTMRWVVPGVTLAALGFQTTLSSFFLSILSLKRK